MYHPSPMAPFNDRLLDDLGSASVLLANVNSRSRPLIAVARPSVCRLSVCLSSVTLVHPTQVVVIFGNISTTFGTLAIP